MLHTCSGSNLKLSKECVGKVSPEYPGLRAASSSLQDIPSRGLAPAVLTVAFLNSLSSLCVMTSNRTAAAWLQKVLWLDTKVLS
jgi:hypothetical protein